MEGGWSVGVDEHVLGIFFNKEGWKRSSLFDFISGACLSISTYAFHSHLLLTLNCY